MVGISVLLSFTQEFRSTRAAEKLKAMVRNTATVTRRAVGRPQRAHRGAGGRAGGRRHRAPGRRRHGAGRPAPAHRQGPVHQPGDPHRRIAAGGEGRARRRAIGRAAERRQSAGPGHASATWAPTWSAAPPPRWCWPRGARTYLGSLARSLSGQRVQTSFDRGVNSVSWLLIRFMAVMVPIVFLINGFDKHDWLQAFLFALSVAVGLTPEMLPLIVTANLGKGALAMSRRKVVVKRLNAIQNFGAMDVLCTDKTGTLTLDKIVLERHLDLDGEESDEALEYGYLNSRFQTGLKNLMDKAVLAHRDLEPAASRYRAGRRDPVRLPAPAHVGGAWPTAAASTCWCARARWRRCWRSAPTRSVGGEIVPMTDERRAADQGDDPRPQRGRPARAGGGDAPAAGRRARPTAWPTRPGLTAVGCLAFLDPPKDSAATAIRALAPARRRGEGDHRRQRGGDPQDLPRGRPGRGALGAGQATSSRSTMPRSTRWWRAPPCSPRCRRCRRRAWCKSLQRAGPHRGLPRRRHQRRAGAARGGRRHLGRHRHRHRQGVGRHHPAGEEPDGAGGGRDRGPRSPSATS